MAVITKNKTRSETRRLSRQTIHQKVVADSRMQGVSIKNIPNEGSRNSTAAGRGGVVYA